MALFLNYDTSNTLTCTGDAARPEADIDYALPASAHIHLKDVVGDSTYWSYTAIGSGESDYGVVLQKIKAGLHIPLSLELPLRLKRDFHKDIIPLPAVVPLNIISETS